jgi:chromosomal replication initiator protein
MTTVSGEVWTGILEDLTRHLSPQALDTWLRPLNPRSVSASNLELEAPNQFHLQYVEDKFGNLLRDSALRRLGPDGQVDLVVGHGSVSGNGSGNGTGAAPTAPVDAAPDFTDPEIEAYTSALDRATKASSPGRPRQAPPLNTKYTFDTFVVGKSNQFAHAAALAVAQHPAGAYNPLFIFGGSGLGKTHVMQAIGNAILRAKPETLVHYASAESRSS